MANTEVYPQPVGDYPVGNDGINALPVRLMDSTGNTPVQATRISLLPSTNVATATSGVGAAVSVSAYRELLVTLNVTAESGTSPTLNVYIDISDDGGTTWYTHVYQIGATNIAAAGVQLPLTLAGANGKAFGDTIRVAYTTGGTPNVTFIVNAIGK